MDDPRTTHLNMVFYILRYLKSAPRKYLFFFNHGHLKIEVFTDANWIEFSNDRRSITGYCSFVGDNLVTWRSKK